MMSKLMRVLSERWDKPLSSLSFNLGRYRLRCVDITSLMCT
jgi:hypothetical protein